MKEIDKLIELDDGTRVVVSDPPPNLVFYDKSGKAYDVQVLIDKFNSDLELLQRFRREESKFPRLLTLFTLFRKGFFRYLRRYCQDGL